MDTLTFLSAASPPMDTDTLPAVLVLLAMSLSVPVAGGHGTVDQMLDGNPSCASENLPSFVSAGYALQQEFAPASSHFRVSTCVSELKVG